MPVLSQTLSRLYTPPTCTLEVTAKSSPLSRWTRSLAIQSLQFSLSFDSLAHHAREPIAISGDQTQLSALSEAVTQYIQMVLASRPTELPLAIGTEDSGPAAPSQPVTATVGLRPRSLLTHELFLGNLATEQSGPSVLLKASQLYDLAAALEDCATELQQIPSLIAAERPAVLPLLRSAAVVLLAVGLGTATWKLFQTGPIAVRPTAPTAETAMAPPVTPLASPTPPATLPFKPLNLPTIQLPTRSGNRGNLSEVAQNQPSPAQPSGATNNALGQSQRIAKAPSLQGNTQGITRLPPETIQEPSLTPGQAFDSSAPTIKAARSRAFAQGAEAAAPAPLTTAQQPTLFDTIPQVAEVREYVASRWKPTTPPPKTLEYRVTLNTDGSLGKVEPLGASAQQYLDQVPLPSGATAFVSPSTAGARPSIRLVLRQDKTVQTFLDPAGQ